VKALRAILLARVSTPKEAQESSTDRQISNLRATAAARRWDVVLELMVDESGRDVLGRRDVQLALDLIRRRRAEVLAVDHLFRLGRNAKEMLETVDQIAAAGGAFYEQEREIDATGPFGRLAFTLLAAVGEFYARDTSRKVLEGLAHARARGKRLGKPPSGRYARIEAAVKLRAAGQSGPTRAAELGGTPGGWSRAVGRALSRTGEAAPRGASQNQQAPAAAKSATGKRSEPHG
jgi:DNA invertase Pin-like site-specific DNA recombinase